MATLSIHHVGIAVEDLDAAARLWTELVGAAVEHREVVPDQGVEAVSLRTGTGRVELLAPLGDDTPVGRFLAKRGPGMHHVAFEVADVAAELERLRQSGVQLIDERPRHGLFGLQVAFVHPDSTGGVLAELVADERG
jgi:methylmalonyl-CoA/ethylmalonyl-CoA epimerase